MSKITVEKVVAYITRGDRLLVFSHPHHPEAGIQVPAGMVETGESLENAALREAREETGLDSLRIRAYLGMRECDWSTAGQPQILRQHFYHLVLCGEAPARWRHCENHPSDGSPEPVEFEFFWVGFPNQVLELAGGQGGLLHGLEAVI